MSASNRAERATIPAWRLTKQAGTITQLEFDVGGRATHAVAFILAHTRLMSSRSASTVVASGEIRMRCRLIARLPCASGPSHSRCKHIQGALCPELGERPP